MDQQSTPSAPSSPGASSSSASTQPETQEYSSSSLFMTQPPPSLALLATQPSFTQQHPAAADVPATALSILPFTQMTESSSLLATQPNTQVENHQVLATAASNYEYNDQLLITQQQPITQPITQPCNDSMNMCHDSGELDETVAVMNGEADGNNNDTRHDTHADLDAEAIRTRAQQDVDSEHPSLENDASAAVPMAMAMDVRADLFDDSNLQDANNSVQGTQPNNERMALEMQPRPMMQNVSDSTDITHSRKEAQPHGIDSSDGGDETVLIDNAMGNSNDTSNHTATTAHYKKRTVTNPYAKNKKCTPASLKRPIDQISSRSSSSSSSSVVAPAAAAAIAAPPRKQAFNPYAKPIKQQTPKQHAVRNPYAKVAKVANPAQNMMQPPLTANNTVAPMQMMKTPGTIDRDHREPVVAASRSNNPPTTTTPVRRKGISLSLPMAERLPSRNVSYQPAEILTVGELYRYLYNHTEEGTEALEGENASSCTSADSTPSQEIVSVRITGTLLSVANSIPNENDATRGNNNLYSNGTFLLIGDPLENTRFLKKEKIPSRQSSGVKASNNTANGAPVATAAAATPSILSEATPKTAKLTSILRNKKTPSSSMMSVVKTPGSKPAAVAALRSNESTVMTIDRTEQPSSTTAATEQPSSTADVDATPAIKPTNDSNNNTTTVNNSNNRSRSVMNRGILNTNKKKKNLVYNGGGAGGGKRLSFGGGGLGGGKGGGLLGRKFITPKRGGIVNSTSTTSTGPLLSSVRKDLMNRVGLSSAVKKRSLVSVKKSYIGSTTAIRGKNPRPEYIIQRHPSPLVPVWIGSFYNGDGLDGSVVGDLVMIMGEIVIERCGVCQMRSCMSDDNNNDDDENNDACSTHVDTRDDNNAGGEDAHKQSSHTSLLAAPTQIRTVSDAAISIAACAVNVSRGVESSSQQTQQTRTPAQEGAMKRCTRIFCNQCPGRFISARFVKNANGTDMSLQREALQARRAYMAERRRQMECLMPTTNSLGLYSVGCGPQPI